MRHVWTVFVVSLATFSCLDTQLPTPPIVGPGSVRATLVSAFPGRQDLSPAKGATVTLVGSTLSAIADDDGNVLLSGLTSRSGRLLFSLDAEGDGVVERSRVITLEAAQAGFGKDINLGQLVLGRNATIVGTVKRGDRVQLPAGHGGIAVFLPQLPGLTHTREDGSYTLSGVPEGNVVVSTFAAGYRSEASAIDVGAGREERVDLIVLQPDPGAPAVGQLSGRVQQLDGTPIAAVQVRAASRGTQSMTSTNAEGRFVFEALPTGVYALGLDKTGLRSLKVDSLLVSPGLNAVGPFVMTAGQVPEFSLDGGPSGPPDAGSAGGGNAAGGNAAGGSAAGGSAAGGSAAGGSAAGGSAAGGSAAGGSAGGGSAGGIAGQPPVAAAGDPQVVLPGTQITLNGAGSAGDPPLRYSWTQLAGSPPVTLSDNNSLTAHDARFTSPADGSIVEFSLVVTDRFNRSSTNTSVARIAVGSMPTARFVPNSGLFSGGQTAPFQSTSFDDGGLPLLRYDWTVTGSAALQGVDGGTAIVTFNPVAFMAPDELAGVELRVTNAIGATSTPFARSFLVRGANPNNWSVDAGSAMAFAVGASPPTVTLFGSVAPATAMPLVSWSCNPPLTLLTPNALTPQFVAPVIAGPPRTFICTMNALGMPPLSPAMLSTSVAVNLRDAANPTILSFGLQNGHMSPFGWVVRFSEEVQSVLLQVASCGLTNSNGPRLEPWGTNGIVAPRGRLSLGSFCGPFSSALTDLASNATALLSLSGPSALLVEANWVGPWVTSADFADPRPAIVTMGPLPKEELQRWSPPMPVPAAFETIAREGTSLLRSNDVDPFVPDAGCGVGCSFAFQSQALAGLGAGAPPNGHRVFFGGGSLFATLEAGDGGVDGDLVSRRTKAGVWLPATRTSGSAFQVKDTWSQVRVSAGSVLLDVYDGPSGVLLNTELVATGQSDVGAISASENYVLLAGGPTRALATYRRSGLTWVSATPPVVNNVSRIALLEVDPDLPYAVIERTTSPQLQVVRIDSFPSVATLVNSGVQGWSYVIRGGLQLVAASVNGDVRLVMGSNSSSYADFNGPPRAGFPSPPAPLDVDVLCEAVYPHLALIEDALVVTWQERCAPQTRWRIATRVIR